MVSPSDLLLAAVVRRINEALDTRIRVTKVHELGRALAKEARGSDEAMGFVVNLGKSGSNTLKGLMKGLGETPGIDESDMKHVEQALRRVSKTRGFKEIQGVRMLEMQIAHVTGEKGLFKGAASLSHVKQKVQAYVRREGPGAAGRLWKGMTQVQVKERMVSTTESRAIQGFLKGLENKERRELIEGQRSMAASRRGELRDIAREKGEGVASLTTRVVKVMQAQQQLREQIKSIDLRVAGASLDRETVDSLRRERRSLLADYADNERLVASMIRNSKINKRERSTTASNISSPVGTKKFDTKRASIEDRLEVSTARDEKERKMLQKVMELQIKRRSEILLPLAEIHKAIQVAKRAGHSKEVTLFRLRAKELDGELTKIDKDIGDVRKDLLKEKMNKNLKDVKDRFGRKPGDVTANMSQTGVRRSAEENARRVREAGGGGKDNEVYWNWIITSGKYRGRTLGWLYEHKRDYFIQAHNQDGRGWSLLGSRDRGKLDKLVENSRELRRMIEEYWEERGNRDPMSLRKFAGWHGQDLGPRPDRQRMKSNTKGSQVTEWRRVWDEEKKEFKMVRNENAGEWVRSDDEVGTPRSKMRGEKTNDPEARESFDRQDVRRDLFGEAWQQARRKYNEFGQWKQTRRNGEKGWKRRNPVTGRMEFKRRNPEGWRLNEFYETQQAMAEWRVKFERAQEVIRYRDMAAGKRGDREQTIDEVEKEIGKMGDVVELHVKKKKLEYMLDKGYLKGEQALIGKEYEGMSREERDVVRKEAMMARDMEDRKGSVEDGRTGGQMGRDRLEREGAIGKDDVPLWQRIEEAGSEGELEKLQEEIYGEFGEVNVRRLEAQASRAGHTGIQEGRSEENDLGVSQGWGIGKLMQEKRNVLRAASSS